MHALVFALGGDFGPRHGRFDDGHHPFLFLFIFLLLAAAVVLAVVLVRGRGHQPIGAGPGHLAPPPAVQAEAILSERFARGEIPVEEFVAARAALRGEWVPTQAPPSTPPAG